ncbi:MAG: GCN5-related N-acetyltransferase [Clostridia bacterium]|jgi:ribosomal protein S18 acetylase RimI-like enzyme|nr:GCN5-related N-acetyltransferase [Clostridia bacterium]
MIHYKNCSEIELEKVYTGFKLGFSDYMIKLDISQADFLKRFFGPEGNSLEYSFIALDDEEPIGVVLGGIKNYEGIKTMRCGTLCIHPDYRGKGVSQELFKLHKQIALDNKCKQMFLEVISGNDRAVKFYSRLGYHKIYDISYYTHSDAESFIDENNRLQNIRQIDYEAITSISSEIADIHINWQNDMDYVKKLDDITYYGAYKDSALVGILGINTIGKIYFVWTMPQYRYRGIASSLIIKAVKELQLKRLSISFPNNSKLEGFVRYNKFERDKISQYEMYLTL